MEESYDDFPSCYQNNDYSEYLRPHSPNTGKRPNFSGTSVSFSVQKHMPFVETWVTQEHKALAEKQPVNARERVDQGMMAKKASDRGSSARTAICQFFRFVAMTQKIKVADFVPSEQQLLSQITVKAFLEFYSQHCGSPNSAGNVAKYLVSLFKYMQVRL